MEREVSVGKSESVPFNPSGEPSCGLAAELWAEILSYLKGADPLRLMQSSTVHRGLVWEVLKFGEPLEGKPSELLVQAARTNDAALVCRCFRAGFSGAGAPSPPLVYKLAAQVSDLEKLGKDASSARLALGGLVRSHPDAFYIENQSMLQKALKERKWDLSLILLQCGVSVNHKDRLEGAKAPIVTCLESMTSDEPPTSELLDALLGEGLKVDALNHPSGSPVWLIVDFAAKVPDYTAPESFKERLGIFLKGNPKMLNATRMERFRDWQPTKTTPLHCLIGRGSIKWVEWLLEIGADPNAKAEYGRAPLAHCIKARGQAVEDRIAMATALIAKGAKLNAQDDNGCTALHRAAQCKTPKFVEFLVEQHGIALNVQNSLVHGQRTAVYIACSNTRKGKHVRALLQAGASVLYVSANKTPLLRVVYSSRRNSKAGRALYESIREKTDKELKELESVEPCWLADFAIDGTLTSYELVLAKTTDLNGVGREGRTALGNWAARLDWPEVERLLNLGARVDVGKLPLHAALSAAGSAKDAERILSGLWEKLLTKETAQGALLPLLKRNWAEFGEEAEKLQLSLCKKILSYDKALHLDEGFKGSPLDKVACFKRPDLIEAMLKAAYPDGLPKELPWIEGASSCEAAVELFGQLFHMGLPERFVGRGDRTLLHLAARANNAPLVSYLAKKKGMSLAALDAGGHTAVHLAAEAYDSNWIAAESQALTAFIRAEIPLELPDREGLTPLARACIGRRDGSYKRLKSISAIRTLLDAGAKPNVASAEGEPILLVLCGGGKSEEAMDTSWIERFRKAGADLSAQDREGRTLLHRWAAKPCNEFFRFFPKELALVKVQDSAGNTPLHVALRDSKATLELLEHFSECEGLGSVFEIPNKIGVTPEQMVLEQTDGLLEHFSADTDKLWRYRLHWNLRSALIDLALKKQMGSLALELLSFDERRDERVRGPILLAAVKRKVDDVVDELLTHEGGANFPLAMAFLAQGLDDKALAALSRADSAAGDWLLDLERPDLLLRWSKKGGVPTSETVERICEDAIAHKELIETWADDLCVHLTSSAIKKFIDQPKSHEMLLNWLKKDDKGLDESSTLYAFTQGHKELGLELLKALKSWHVKSIGSVADDQGRTLGHLAVIHGDEDFVRRHECDPYRQDFDGNTLMHLAALHDRRKVAKQLAPSFIAGARDDWLLNKQNKLAFQIILEGRSEDPEWRSCIEGYLFWMSRCLSVALPKEEKRHVIYQLIKEKGLARRAAELWFEERDHCKTGLPALELYPTEIRDGLDLDNLPESPVSASPENSSESSSSSSDTGRRASPSSGPSTSSSSEASLASKPAGPEQKQNVRAKRAFVVAASALAAALGLTLLPRLWRSLKLLTRNG